LNDNEANETDMVISGIQFDADNYFIEVKKDNKRMMLRVDTDGDVLFLKTLNSNK